MKIRITAFFLLAAMFLVSCSGGDGYKDSRNARDIASIDTIVHAAGELWGYDTQGTWRSFLGSNSLEGLENCAEQGVRAVELDFNFTSDGKLVGIHNWSPEYADNIEMGVPLTYDEFMDSEIFWNFTPIDTSDVCDFLKNNEDTYIVTDIKDRFFEALSVIMSDCGEYADRIIVQIYETEQYDEVRRLGFDNVILTLYMLPWEEKTDADFLIEFEKDHPLVAFTFAASLCDEKEFLDAMLASDVPLFIHTVNGAEERQKYLDMGIDGIYTDDVEP